MHSVQVHKRINQMMSLFYRVGLWSRGDKATVVETRFKLFYSLYYLLFIISLIIGVFSSASRDEFVFSVEIVVMGIVLSVKLLYLIWKKKQIIELLNRIGVYSLEDDTEFNLVNDPLNSFMKIMTKMVTLVVFMAFSVVCVLPILGSEKEFFFNIAFPLDYESSDIAYWMAFTFVATESLLCMVAFSFSILMWYLMINCALRYDVLGHQMKSMGLIRSVGEKNDKRKVSHLEKQKKFLEIQKKFLCDLLAAIESHKYTKELIFELDSFFSKVFLIQIATSGLCICTSTYSLVFSNSETFIEYLLHLAFLVYNILDIFMVMYFSNEIKLSSDQLSYCLFESDWVDQLQSTRKYIIVFGELIRRPHELVILTIYPITLETFNRILNSAYSMFNILKNLKQ